MSKSVVICKIVYYRPSAKSKSTNYQHVRYIALKPEADRGDEQSLRIGDEDYRPEPDSAAGHVEYAAERPGSSGLFSQDDESPPDWREVARELSHHDLPVWRVIVSLREDDAVRLGMTTRADWEPAIGEGVRNAIKHMSLNPDRARWVAAFHQKQGHPHAHVVIWETPHDASRRKGLLWDGERKGVWRSFAGQLFQKERQALYIERTAIRDTALELAKGDIAKARVIIQDINSGKTKWEVQALDGGTPGIPPTQRPAQQAEIASKLEALASVMPGHGRVALAYMPEEVKDQARGVADWLLSQPGFAQSAERFSELARELASHYTSKPDALAEAGQKAHEDLRNRVAQVVLRSAAELNKVERQGIQERERAARSTWRGAWRAIERERLKMEAKAKLAAFRAVELAEERGRRERDRQIDGR